MQTYEYHMCGCWSGTARPRFGKTQQEPRQAPTYLTLRRPMLPCMLVSAGSVLAHPGQQVLFLRGHRPPRPRKLMFSQWIGKMGRAQLVVDDVACRRRWSAASPKHIVFRALTRMAVVTSAVSRLACPLRFG